MEKQTNQIKSTKLNQIYQTKPNLPNQTKPIKPNEGKNHSTKIKFKSQTGKCNCFSPLLHNDLIKAGLTLP